MKLLAILRRSAGSSALLGATGLGALAGLANTGAVAVINHALSRDATPGWRLGVAYAALCLLLTAARVVSASMLLALGARAANALQLGLARRILAAPLVRLEELGTHRLMAALVEDIGTLSQAVTTLPNTLINLIVVAGCLAYLGALSLPALLLVLAVMAVGGAGYRLSVRAGARRQQLARRFEDELFAHLRGLTQGAKELKARRPRREEFLALLAAAATSFRRLRVVAQRIFVAAGSWGSLLFLSVIGGILFLVPAAHALPREARNGYVLVLLFASAPLQVVFDTFPLLSQAAVAVRQIEQLGLSLLDEPEPVGTVPPAAWRRLELA
ncbi:MAG TPA: hypothetical protein VJA16_10230, partial [Thermoanaerobaculia bacterium]